MKKYLSEFGESPVIEDNAEPTPEEIGWLAGIFDGEGSIALARKSNRQLPSLGFHITNTSISLMSKCQYIMQKILRKPLGIHNRSKYQIGHIVKSRRVVFTLDVRGHKEVKKLLLAVLPYLTAKSRKARLAIDYLERRIKNPGKNRQIYGVDKEVTLYVDRLISQWRGVETERETLDFVNIVEKKPQSELISNDKSATETLAPCDLGK